MFIKLIALMWLISALSASVVMMCCPQGKSNASETIDALGSIPEAGASATVPNHIEPRGPARPPLARANLRVEGGVDVRDDALPDREGRTHESVAHAEDNFSLST